MIDNGVKPSVFQIKIQEGTEKSLNLYETIEKELLNIREHI